MKQLTLATASSDRYAKTTRRAASLAEMERVVPWLALCALIEPFYPKPAMGARRSGSSGCCGFVTATPSGMHRKPRHAMRSCRCDGILPLCGSFGAEDPQ
jgi:hypothetical protein